MRYVLDGEAGVSAKLFSNSQWPRDCDANGVREDRKVLGSKRAERSTLIRLPPALTVST